MITFEKSPILYWLWELRWDYAYAALLLGAWATLGALIQ